MDRYRMLPSYHYYDVEGNSPLTLDKSVGKPLRDYKIYGNSVQDGTPTPENPVEIQCVGDKTKNILPLNDFEGSIAWGGVVDAIISVTPNTTYYFSIQEFERLSNIDSGNIVMYIYSDEALTTTVASLTFNLSGNAGLSRNPYIITFNSGENSVLYCKLRNNMGTSTQIKIKGMMICSEKGADYEPYGKYKIPVEVNGKNLFDSERWIDELKNNSSNNSYYPIVGKDEEYEYIKVSPGGNNASLVFMEGEFKENTQYTLSFMCRKDKEGVCPVGLRFRYTDGTEQVIRNTFKGTDWVALKATSTVNKTILGIRIYYEVGDWGYYANIHLEEGTATDYEPYKEPIKTNIYLDEPLYKVGDYADYIDKINSKVVRNIGSCLLKVTANLNITHDTLAGFYYRTTDRTLEYNTTVVEALSPSLLGIPRSSGISNYNTPAISADTTNKAIRFYLSKETIGGDTSALAQAYLNDNPITAYYILGAPIEQPIDLPPISTHKGTNVISVGTTIQPSNMQIQYYK